MKIALKLILLVAVLVQFAPMRLCALQVAALGMSCHDEPANGHGGDQTCGSGKTPRCICEQPKHVSDHQIPPRLDMSADFRELAVMDVALARPTVVQLGAPDSDSDPPDAFQTPLLI